MNGRPPPPRYRFRNNGRDGGLSIPPLHTDEEAAGTSIAPGILAQEREASPRMTGASRGEEPAGARGAFGWPILVVFAGPIALVALAHFLR
ncbi:hypothetical protein [Rhizomicrobium palustre]|nr:hypothetical protein [Rhizomicrobium palustre]